MFSSFSFLFDFNVFPKFRYETYHRERLKEVKTPICLHLHSTTNILLTLTLSWLYLPINYDIFVVTIIGALKVSCRRQHMSPINISVNPILGRNYSKLIWPLLQCCNPQSHLLLVRRHSFTKAESWERLSGWLSIRIFSHLHFPASLVQRWISLSGPRVFCLWWILGMFLDFKERVLSCFISGIFFPRIPEKRQKEHQCSFCQRCSQPGGGEGLCTGLLWIELAVFNCPTKYWPPYTGTYEIIRLWFEANWFSGLITLNF